MRIFTPFSALTAVFLFFSSARAQSVLNPADPVVTYNPNSPPSEPAYGQIGKWVRTVRMGWNTDAYKAYIYKGVAFRLRFPKSYVPGVSDGKKYPMLVFFHGLGEASPITDNEFHLLWGAELFSNSVENGTFDGYVLFLQTQGFWGGGHYDIVKELIDYMTVNNKVDPFRITANGLSSGGQATWEYYFKYPTYCQSLIPMSSVAWYYGLKETVDKIKFTPTWNAHGGLDGSPTPFTAFFVMDSMLYSGANYKNVMFPYDAHNSWENLWREPDFWPFLNRTYASNPWILSGRKQHCSTGTVADTIGLQPGYDEYQWRKDGILISGATSHKIFVTQAGSYDARVRKGALWSDWSKTPAVISVVACPGTSTRIEAEQYMNMNSVRTEPTSDAGGGLNVGWQETGDWMDYLINVPAAGKYTTTFRVASPSNGTQFQIRKLDGTVLTTVTVPNTGGSQSWQNLPAQVNLPAGEQIFRIHTSNFTGGGWNLNWLQLQATPVNNQPPTVNAGADQTITLPTNSITLTGTAGDADGTIANYIWTLVSGPGGSTFTSPSAASTTVSGLQQGTYRFNLAVIDNWGAATSDDVVITVNIPSSPNSIHVEAENYTAMNGIQTENTSDAGGGLNVGWQDNNDWMDYSINAPAAGSYALNLRVASLFGGAQVQVRNSGGTVLGTFTVPNTGSFQTWQTIVSGVITLPQGQQTIRIYTLNAGGGWNLNWFDVVPLGNTPPPPPPPPPGNTTHIEAENYIAMNGIQTENTSDVGGGLNVGWQDNNDWMDYSVNLGTASTYEVKFRVASMFTGAQFQLRNSNGVVLATMTVPNTGTFQTWQTISTNVALPAGAQTLRIHTSNAAGGWNINWWEIVGGGTTNQPPTVNAGTDQTIKLPASSANLSGTASDPDGTIASYAWSRVSGPSNVTFSNGSSANTSVSGLVQGTYVIRLTVIDNGGASAFDELTISVVANQPPTVNAGTDQTVTLPTSTTSLSGAASDPDGTIASYLWSRVSGPSNVTFSSGSTANTNVSGLVQGTYVLRLTVTDNGGATTSDDVTVTVVTNQPPVVNAGVDQTITLPTSSTTLNGNASDPDGTISTYAWTKISGPAGSSFGTPSAASTTVSGLVQGSYVFRLTVTDNKGATASDDIGVTVNAAGSTTTIHIEAENYTSMFGIQLESTADVGGGQNVGWQDNNDWMNYSVNVPSAGTYTVRFRVATEKTNPQFQLRNSSGTPLATLTVPYTGGFQVWQTITATVTLPAGAQTLRIYTTVANGGWNINWWEIVGSGGTVTQLMRNDQPLLLSVEEMNIYPNPVINNFRLSVSNNYSGRVRVDIVNAHGVVVKTFNLQKSSAGLINYDLAIPELQKGVYIIRSSGDGWSASKQVIKQ